MAAQLTDLLVSTAEVSNLLRYAHGKCLQDSFGILPNVGGRPPYSQNLSFLAVLGGLLVMMAFIIRMLYQVNSK